MQLITVQQDPLVEELLKLSNQAEGTEQIHFVLALKISKLMCFFMELCVFLKSTYSKNMNMTAYSS